MEVNALNWLKIICDIMGIAVSQDELSPVRDRDAAESHTPSCIIKYPGHDVTVGRGTVLLTFFIIVTIIDSYLAVNREGNMDLWTSYEMAGSVE